MSLTVHGGPERQSVNWDLASVRLLLQPLRVADLNLLHRLWTDKQVRKFLWDGKMIALELTEEILQKNECLFRDSGFGLWETATDFADEHGSAFICEDLRLWSR